MGEKKRNIIIERCLRVTFRYFSSLNWHYNFIIKWVLDFLLFNTDTKCNGIIVAFQVGLRGRTISNTFGHLMWRANSLEKTLMLGKIEVGGEEGNRGWDGWMASLTQWTRVWLSPRSWWWTGKPGILKSMGLQRVGHDWATELNWTKASAKT